MESNILNCQKLYNDTYYTFMIKIFREQDLKWEKCMMNFGQIPWMNCRHQNWILLLSAINVSSREVLLLAFTVCKKTLSNVFTTKIKGFLRFFPGFAHQKLKLFGEKERDIYIYIYI